MAKCPPSGRANRGGRHPYVLHHRGNPHEEELAVLDRCCNARQCERQLVESVDRTSCGTRASARAPTASKQACTRPRPGTHGSGKTPLPYEDHRRRHARREGAESLKRRNIDYLKAHYTMRGVRRVPSSFSATRPMGALPNASLDAAVETAPSLRYPLALDYMDGCIAPPISCAAIVATRL
jgi:hypothetical protein